MLLTDIWYGASCPLNTSHTLRNCQCICKSHFTTFRVISGHVNIIMTERKPGRRKTSPTPHMLFMDNCDCQLTKVPRRNFEPTPVDNCCQVAHALFHYISRRSINLLITSTCICVCQSQTKLRQCLKLYCALVIAVIAV